MPAMDSFALPPYTLKRLPDGRIVAEHEQLAIPVEVPESLLLRVVKTAARQSLDFPGKVTPAVSA